MSILDPRASLTVLTLLLACNPGEASEIIALRSLESWESSRSESATTLSVVEFSCQQESRRVFVSFSGGDDWVLESLVQPGNGYARWLLVHRESGWSVRVEDRYEGSIDVHSPSLYGDVLFWQTVAASEPVARDRVLLVGEETAVKDSSPAPLLSRDDLAESFPSSRMRKVLDGQVPAQVAGGLDRLLGLMRAPEGVTGTFSHFLPLAERVAARAEEEGGDEPDRPHWKRVETQAFAGSTRRLTEVVRSLRADPGATDRSRAFDARQCSVPVERGARSAPGSPSLPQPGGVAGASGRRSRMPFVRSPSSRARVNRASWASGATLTSS